MFRHPEPPRRLVSLCPSLTELICALGVGDRLVGATRYCTHPAAVLSGVEKVGGTKDPRCTRIVELAPDVVFVNREENRREDAEALRRAGLALHVSHPRKLEDVLTLARELTTILAVPDDGADALDSSLTAELAAAQHRNVARSPVRFAYLIWRKPWMAAGAGTFIDALMTAGGGENVFGDRRDPYPAVTSEELLEASPELVVLPDEPFPFAERHREELARTTGWARARFRLADGRLLSWHGPSVVEGLRLARRLLNGR